jgi:hypothetical protein
LANDWILTLLQLTRYSLPSNAYKYSVTEMDQPNYSPDLAPKNYWLFPKKRKSALKRWRFQDIEDIHPKKYDECTER